MLQLAGNVESAAEEVSRLVQFGKVGVHVAGGANGVVVGEDHEVVFLDFDVAAGFEESVEMALV